MKFHTISILIAFAQCAPLIAQARDPYLVQDSTYIDRAVEGRTIPERMITAAYYFDIKSDTNSTSYRFAHCRKNDVRLRLRDWSYRREQELCDSELSARSRTDDFKMTAGDTISFYRELDWDTENGEGDIDTYRARTTLAFSVELVSTRNAQRLTLLDTMCILRRLCPGRAIYFGSNCIIASPSFVVPKEMDGDSGFVRIRVYSGGGYYRRFTRSDAIAVDLDSKVSDTNPALVEWRRKFPAYLSRAY